VARRLTVWGLVCVLVGGVLGAAGFAAPRVWDLLIDRPGPLPAAEDILVPHGTTTGLAQVLRDDGVVDTPLLFKAAAWVTIRQGPLRAAEFAFPAHASIAQVLAILRTARPVQHPLTIAEGLTEQQISSVVAHAGAMDGTVPKVEEGSVLPQTYDYEYGASRSVMIGRAQAAMERLLDHAWTARAAGLPLTSAHEALILASIVERETAKPEERAHVAAVYLNRLRQGMRLEADPTVIYAASNGAGSLDHLLTKADLRVDSPYNTYRYAGLPPGPICSPGRDSIEAVMHPAVSDDLYFVADGTGGHVFSRDYASHDAAVARWRGLNETKTKQ
jgi:UPF0755 protein